MTKLIIKEFANKKKKTFEKLISPEKIKQQKFIFNRSKFGNLQFHINILYKSTNVFFTFYCRSEKYLDKSFVFFKTSLGLENRDKIRKKLIPKVFMRGRRKNQFTHMRNKLNYFKAYIYDFIKAHPEIVAYKRFFITWQIHLLDTNLYSLLKQNFNITYSYSILNRIIKEHIKNEILFKLNLREKLNITDHDIIYNFFINKKRNKYKKLINLLLNSKDIEEEKKKQLISLPLNTNKDNFLLEEKKQLKNLSLNDKNIEEEKKNHINYVNKYLEKNIKLTELDFISEQPQVLSRLKFKFVHNGCRPKKARRLKRKR